MADSVEIELLPLTEMISRMFSPDFVEFIKTKYGNLRKFYETSAAITQCHNTIGAVVRGETKCWICGFTIPEGSKEAFTPECEHVFPIAQAIFFIGLYTNDVKDNDEYIEKLKLEYDWAHRVCNQIKSDAHFIVHNIENPDGRWSISDDKIRDFLDEILVRGNTYGGGAELLKQEMRMEGISRIKWIERQTARINIKCKKILSQIRPEHENLWLLTTVSDLALLYQNSGFVPEVIAPYNTIAQLRPGEPPTPTEVINFYTAWAKFIMKNVQISMIAYLGERLRRYTVVEKALRSNKVLNVLKNSQLISKIRQQHLPQIYNTIPNNPNKQPRFVEAVQYLILSVVYERISRIFTDVEDINSPSLIKLKSQISVNIETIINIWNANGLQSGLAELNNMLGTSLKGASRKK